MLRTLSTLILIIAACAALSLLVKKSALDVSTPTFLSSKNLKLDTGGANHNTVPVISQKKTDNVEKVIISLPPEDIDLLNKVALSESLSSRVQQDTLFPKYSQPFDVSEVDSLPEYPNIFAGSGIAFSVGFDKKVYTTNDVATVSLSGPNPLQVLVNHNAISHQSPPTSLQLQLSDYELPIIITVIDNVTSNQFRLQLDVLSVIQGDLHIDPFPLYEHNHMAINYRLESAELGYFMIRALLLRDDIPVAILTSEQYKSESNKRMENMFKVDAALLKDLDKGKHTWSLDNIFIEKLGDPSEEDKIIFIDKRVELFGVEGSALSIDKEERMEREKARLNLLQPLLFE